VFRACGVPVRTVNCLMQDGRIVLTAVSDPCPDSVNRTQLTKRLGKACGCLFALPSVRTSGETVRWRFSQTARLRLRTGTAQYASDGRVCGDFFLTFPHDGRQILLLCDGMGTGAEAAADAEATAEIFASLVEADLSFSCALRTVNEAMLLREDTESVSALDAVQIDLFTGDTVFYKAGAAASYVLHKGKVDRVETPCMPVGILPDAAFRETKRTLHAGDVIVLVSDGTCGMRDDHVVEALAAFRGGSAQRLAEDVLARARAANKMHADDSTVLAVVAESV
jgi:stage II sporulation protein E